MLVSLQKRESLQVGCVSALAGLAQTYAPCWHPVAWGLRNASRPLSARECPFRRNTEDTPSSGGQDLFLLEHCVCLLSSSPFLTDQTFHQELLQLSGQLIAGEMRGFGAGGWGDGILEMKTEL